MDGKEVVEILYAEFGSKEFLTRNITEATMSRLAKLMGIPEIGQSRKIKVGKFMSDMERQRTECVLHSGQRAKMVVTRPADKRHPRRFQIVVLAPMDDK